MNFYPIIADDLEGNQVRVSKNYILPETDPKTGSLEQLTVESAFCGETLPIYVTRTKEENTMEEKGHFIKKEKKKDNKPKAADAFANVSVQMDLSDQGGRFIEVSQELFDRLYGEETTQASVYITSYGKTDRVIDKLEAAGYDCISTYRVSATQYLEYKVYQRLEVLGICCIVLLVMGVLEILLLRFLLITQKRERRLLRFLGMRVEQVKKIDYQELGFPCLFLTVLTLLLFWLGGKRNDFLDNILQYETAVSLLLYFAYNGVVMVLAVILFHKKGKQEAWIL
jgi:hypothetical protein